MAGLPRKNTLLRDDFIYENGRPKEGTVGYNFLVKEKLSAFNEGYLAARKDIAKFFYKRLESLAKMDTDGYNECQPLPTDFDNYEIILQCLYNYIDGLRSQLNNTNKNNFKEGSHNLLLKTERLLGYKKGELINTYLKGNTKRYYDNRSAEAKKMKAEKEQAYREVIRKNTAAWRARKALEATGPDATDVLINVKTEIKTENNE